jgi:4-diphosphocytidyl-2-C-methyl-D-erythritol kinase
MIGLLAPAKINLFLEVKNRRPDGYHNIDTLFHSISLFDELTIAPHKDKILFSSDNRSLPKDSGNLVVKAAELLRKTFDVKQGARIHLKKSIPIGAGLGGGSSDAAAALKGLIKLWKLDVPENLLLKLARELGADVPFFLYGGTAAAGGIGEKLRKIEKAGKSWFLLVYPGFGSATKKAYENLKFPLTNKQKINRIVNCLGAGLAPAECKEYLFNRLEEAVFPFYPEIEFIKKTLISMGLASVMSGSGSTVIGIATAQKSVENAKAKLKKWSNWTSWIVRSL